MEKKKFLKRAYGPGDKRALTLTVITQLHWMYDQEKEKEHTVTGVRSDWTIHELLEYIQKQIKVEFMEYQAQITHYKSREELKKEDELMERMQKGKEEGEEDEGDDDFDYGGNGDNQLDDEDDETTVAAKGITNGDIIKVYYRTVMKGACDIGVFESTICQEEASCLTNNQFEKNDKEMVDKLVRKYQGKSEAQITIGQCQSLTKDQISNVKAQVDSLFIEKLQQNATDKVGLEDFKVYLNKEELVGLIGKQSYDELQSMFGSIPDEIIIRRCSSVGKHINFHIDVAIKTLQVALNDDTEYDGGRLVFLSGGKLIAPQRPLGTVTIHDCTIVHGVSKLENGTRYGLFFLKKFI